MNSGSKKLLVAGAIAVVGVTLAWRAMDRAEERVEVVPAHVPEVVVETLSSLQAEVRPTAETADGLLTEAARRAREICASMAVSGRLTASQASDLPAAFRERLDAAIVGDFERARADLLKRGDSSAAGALDPKLEEQWKTQAGETRLAPFGIRQLEIRMLHARGRPVAESDLDMGFGTLTTRPRAGRFPLDGDPEKQRLDVVEVRLPIEKTPVHGGGARPVLVGFQFAWSEPRGQWIPWAICVYKNPNETHSALML